MAHIIWALATLSVLFTVAFGSYKKEQVSLEASFDLGLTWEPYETPHNTAVKSMQLRLAGSNAPVIDVPQCALTTTLRVRIWVDNRALTPFGLSWENMACGESGAGDESEMADLTQVQHVRHDNPTWAPFIVKENSRLSEGDDQSHEGKSKGIFSNYGLYILIFIAVALGQGIRLGLSELQEEARREENERILNRGQPAHQVRIVAPRNKSSARSRKKSKSAMK